MTSREFAQKCKELNKQYYALFGNIPCVADYACTQDDFFVALQKAVANKILIEKYISKKAVHHDGRME